MARKADHKRERFWRELIAGRTRTKRSVADLCWEAGVSTASFFVWQRKLRERGASAATIATTLPATRPAVSPALVPVRIVDDRQPDDIAIIELSDGLRIRIRSGCDATTIGHLLAAAAAAARRAL
jgi:transposase-like protein